MTIQSVLVEYEDNIEKKVYANSGCLISDKYVIITANILVSLITRQNDIKSKLKFLQSGFSPPEILFTHVPNINIVINAQNPYLRKTGKVTAIYVSDCIRKQIRSFFNDWSIDEEDKEQQLKEILSLFLILEVDNQRDGMKNKDMIECLKEICRQSQHCEIKKGSKIVIEGTPFGNRNFLRSQSHGIVSNIFGSENCFILTDTPTSPGCEGSPVHLKSKKKDYLPIGIVLASLSWWKGEWIGLTLCASFTAIFSTIFRKPVQIVRNVQHPELSEIHDVMDYSLVQVVCGNVWGSGILLDKENGIFITNSHVVECDSPVLLIWQDIEIKSRLIYKAPNNEVYDLAILIGDQSVVNKTSLRASPSSSQKTFLGETVFAVGFPLFPKALKPKPTLTKGHVSHITPFMIKTTCTVLAGSSGGGILRKNGELIGLIVCNARIEDSLSAVPRINMAIPISDIIDNIFNYIRTKDITVLQKLRKEDVRIKKEWNFLSSNL